MVMRMRVVVVMWMDVIMATPPLQLEAGGLQARQPRRVVRVLPPVDANVPDDIASAILAHG
jgi:hypothetical protein